MLKRDAEAYRQNQLKEAKPELRARFSDFRFSFNVITIKE